MQRPGEPGAARFGPPEGCADHRSHRYRSFMIEEILTEPPGPKGAAPAAAAAAAGELLKFGVQALLAARPFHSHLGTCNGLGLTGGWESSHGAAQNSTSFSTLFLERPGMQAPGTSLHALQLRSRGCRQWNAQKPGLMSADQINRVCPLLQGGFGFSNRVIGQVQGPEPASPSVAKQSTDRSLCIKMTSVQRSPSFSAEGCLGMAVAAQTGKAGTSEEGPVPPVLGVDRCPCHHRASQSLVLSS